MFFFGEDVGMVFHQRDKFHGQIKKHIGFGSLNSNLFNIIQLTGNLILIGIFIIDMFLNPERNKRLDQHIFLNLVRLGAQGQVVAVMKVHPLHLLYVEGIGVNEVELECGVE